MVLDDTSRSCNAERHSPSSRPLLEAYRTRWSPLSSLVQGVTRPDLCTFPSHPASRIWHGLRTTSGSSAATGLGRGNGMVEENDEKLLGRRTGHSASCQRLADCQLYVEPLNDTAFLPDSPPSSSRHSRVAVLLSVTSSLQFRHDQLTV